MAAFIAAPGASSSFVAQSSRNIFWRGKELKRAQRPNASKEDTIARPDFVIVQASTSTVNGAQKTREGRLYSVGSVPQNLVRWRESVTQNSDKEPLPKKKVYIVRKGPSSWNVEKRIQGRSDLSILTEKGELMASAVGDVLRDVPFDAVFVSPLQRAKKTSEIILARNKFLQKPPKGETLKFDGITFGGFPTTFHAGLQEIDLDQWEGLTRDEVVARFPSEFQTWTSTPWDLELGTGEKGRFKPVEKLWEQATWAWDEILATSGSKILIVAHNAVNKALISTALGMDTRFYRNLQQSYGAINIVNFTETGEVELECLNSTAHLTRAKPSS